jgi:hypothetical protein
MDDGKRPLPGVKKCKYVDMPPRPCLRGLLPYISISIWSHIWNFLKLCTVRFKRQSPPSSYSHKLLHVAWLCSFQNCVVTSDQWRHGIIRIWFMTVVIWTIKSTGLYGVTSSEDSVLHCHEYLISHITAQNYLTLCFTFPFLPVILLFLFPLFACNHRQQLRM